VLRVGVARWTPDETARRLAGACNFEYEPPSEGALADLVKGYEAITGDPIRRTHKRNLLAAAYRVHGADTLPFLADEVRRTGAATNLLGTVRCAPPRPATAPSLDQRDPPEAPGIEVWRCYADLGSGHVRACRPDETVYCGTCHPGRAR
jgi:hypothetical protein